MHLSSLSSMPSLRSNTRETSASDQQRTRQPSFQRRLRRGQTLIIFALSFTVLLGLAGLTIDVARAYDLYARMQRAAEAGALAGALYMPTYYNVVRPGDTNSAISRASKEVVKNGFGSILAPTASACSSTAAVSICQVPGKTNDLVVTIRETLNLVLLSGLGVQPVTLSASGQAEYLPPVQIGARLNYFGDQVECYNSPNDPDPTQTHSCEPDDSGVHLQSFMASFNGPSELKEDGDPYVYCEEGTSYSSALDGSNYSYTTYNGVQTNHQTYSDGIANHCGQPNSGLTPGNPDQQPTGYTGEATKNTSHPGAYNYLISIPQGVSSATLWVFNPSNIPSSSLDVNYDNYNDSLLQLQYYKGPNGNGIPLYTGLHDAPPFFFNITYSLYQVTSLYDRSSDTLVGNRQMYPPYDALLLDTTAHGCLPGLQVYDPYWNGSNTRNSYNLVPIPLNGCFNLIPGTTGSASPYESHAPVPCWQAWCALPFSLNTSAGGLYRLAIEATGLSSQTPFYSSGPTSGYGAHSYALKVCAGASTTPISCSNGASGGNPGVEISAWNDADFLVSASMTQNAPNPNDPSTTCVGTSAPTTPYTCLDLGCIQTAYAGRTVDVRLFDPGDGSRSLLIGVAEANVGNADVTYPGLASTYLSTVDGDAVVQARFSSPNYSAFNGLWLDARITLPPDYTGNCLSGPTGTGWWQLIYAGTGFPHDVVGVQFSLVGSPIHLVPPS